MAECKILWKTNAAVSAFGELSRLAHDEKDLLEGKIRNGNHSEYERTSLLMQLSNLYLQMIGHAYESAANVEAVFLSNAAMIAKVIGED